MYVNKYTHHVCVYIELIWTNEGVSIFFTQYDKLIV